MHQDPEKEHEESWSEQLKFDGLMHGQSAGSEDIYPVLGREEISKNTVFKQLLHTIKIYDSNYGNRLQKGFRNLMKMLPEMIDSEDQHEEL